MSSIQYGRLELVSLGRTYFSNVKGHLLLLPVGNTTTYRSLDKPIPPTLNKPVYNVSAMRTITHRNRKRGVCGEGVTDGVCGGGGDERGGGGESVPSSVIFPP